MKISSGIPLALTAAAVLISPIAYALVGPAPAPLLAAGIPAFLAVGAGALISRLRRRKK